MAEKSKRIEFDLPEGLSIPEGISPSNGEFDALATIKMKDDGSACLVAIDGYRMPGYLEGDEKEKPQEKTMKGYAEAASDGIPKGY